MRTNSRLLLATSVRALRAADGAVASSRKHASSALPADPAKTSLSIVIGWRVSLVTPHRRVRPASPLRPLSPSFRLVSCPSKKPMPSSLRLPAFKPRLCCQLHGSRDTDRSTAPPTARWVARSCFRSMSGACRSPRASASISMQPRLFLSSWMQGFGPRLFHATSKPPSLPPSASASSSRLPAQPRSVRSATRWRASVPSRRASPRLLCLLRLQP